MSKAIEASGGDLDRMASHLRSVQVLDEQFEDWTDVVFHVYRASTTSRSIVLPIQQHRSIPLSGITLDVSGVGELFKRITGFLIWCLKYTPGKFGEQYVSVSRFWAWVLNMISFVISELRQLDRSLSVFVLGWSQRGRDDLESWLYSWAQFIANLKLRRTPQGRRTYGKFEATPFNCLRWLLI